jgi:hypothetical protein
MRRNHEWTCFQHQDSKISRRSEPENLFGAIPTEHAGANNDRIEGAPAFSYRLVPSTTDEATDNVQTRRCPLHIRRRLDRVSRVNKLI